MAGILYYLGRDQVLVDPIAMKVTNYISGVPNSLLDVGCNIGAWLQDCAQHYPAARLAGIDINESALKMARGKVPTAVLLRSGSEAIPFAARTFDYVTCLEVLEHLPAELRPTAFREMQRVLRPGGKLILTVPHAGWFSSLDPNNMRLRFPRPLGVLAGHGLRDANYYAVKRKVEWHHHFTLEELLALAGNGWRVAAVKRGGLLLYPLMAWLSWPFYRAQRSDHPIRRFFERMAFRDYAIYYGRASYGILIVFERQSQLV